ncbi:8356_t:CDS:1 [Funneliformis mosseae]|uniref:8356_t:CDS:1 n=1 Tax=Funneliformis mosseae TaxID=27381 RepID=A0A9N8VBW8_FUNMO|nr:8356_t:CDS:1 [Funneliformis mosseae]
MDPDIVVRLRPPPIPVITITDLTDLLPPANASMNTRDIQKKYFNGARAYEVASNRQRVLQGIDSLPNYIARFIYGKNWNSEPSNVKQAYCDIAHRAYETYQERCITFNQRTS